MEGRNGNGIFEMPEPNLAKTVCFRMKHPLHVVLLACVCGASLAACDNSDYRDSAARISGEEQLGLLTSLSEIEGFWLIERFEDFEPSWRDNTPWRNAYLHIDDNRITYSVGCNQSGNPASIGTDGILYDTGDGSRLQTLKACGPDREARDERFFAFFGSKPEVRRISPGRIWLKSNAGELVLIEPGLWRQAHKPDFHEIQGRWVPQMSTSYDGWSSAGFGIGDNPGIVTIERERLSWSQCPDLPIPIRWTADARLASTGKINVSDCPVVARKTSNGPGAVMTMLTAGPAVIRTGADRIVLVDGTGEKGRQIDFRSEESILNPPPPPMLKATFRPRLLRLSSSG